MENISICEKFSDEVENFKEWIKDQPELPENMSKLKYLTNLNSFLSELKCSRKSSSPSILESV